MYIELNLLFYHDLSWMLKAIYSPGSTGYTELYENDVAHEIVSISCDICFCLLIQGGKKMKNYARLLLGFALHIFVSQGVVSPPSSHAILLWKIFFLLLKHYIYI